MNTRTHLTPPRRRGIGVALAATLSGITLLTGCNAGTGTDAGGSSASVRPAPVSGSPSAAPVVPTGEAFDPAEVLAAAGKKPYAANTRTVSELNGTPSSTTSGRSNLNGRFTGRMEIRVLGGTTEVVTTDDAHYVRGGAAAGAEWTRRPRTDNGAGTSYEGYARLLLEAGPSARKGMEEQGGVATYHLAGRLGLAQIASVDPRIHASMKAKGVTGFDIDQWIDGRGRTLRFEQRFELRGVEAANTVTFSDFGPAERFTAPTGG
ncbi:hypothetical protein ACGFYE_21830 [Streptomyces zaomyceticus]|uniref:hypothetical protein n=1 Tax=Streptomyces zaomyceticus TaxID=68286 RepID=UPI00371A83AF